MLHSSCGDSSRRTHRTVTFQPDATVASGGNARGRSVKRLSHGGGGGGGGNGELTLEKLTFGAGLIFILVNVVLIYQYMPRHDTHKHSHSRFDRWWRQKLKRFSTEIPTSPLPPGGDQDAPSAMLRALTQCAAAPRCACLQHGLVPGSETLYAAFPSVAFFVLLQGAAAQQLATRLHASNHSHVYVLRADLQAKGPTPMSNDVLNPRGERLSALQALRASNEFFDLQIVHTTAPHWLMEPTADDARHVLSLAARTLLYHPTDTGTSAWARAIAASSSPAAVPRASPVGDEPAAIDGVAAAASVAAEIKVEGCPAAPGTAAAGGVEGGGGSGCSAGPLRDSSARHARFVELASMRRLNAHHFSCWHSPRCHQRMYVMDLAATPNASSASAAGAWQRRVPRLHRVDDGTRIGPHKFATLEEAWALRGKDLGFDTGGLNLDTAIGLQLDTNARTRLAAQFLALPVGRDMMLWNIIVGRRGLYAIDQEGHAFDDGAVPWGDRVWPYYISVRDCYEKALGALCGRQGPKQNLNDCFATLTRAELCPDAAKPFPCPNGCKESFVDCSRRGQKEAVFVERNL